MELETARAVLSCTNGVTERMLPGLQRRPSPTVTLCTARLVRSTDIAIARDNDFDVVLIDTAGRMQDNEVCMHSSRLWNSDGLIKPSSR
jgi:hypothetical protein